MPEYLFLLMNRDYLDFQRLSSTSVKNILISFYELS